MTNSRIGYFESPEVIWGDGDKVRSPAFASSVHVFYPYYGFLSSDSCRPRHYGCRPKHYVCRPWYW